jgi:signal transduction histidine kinase
MSEKIATVTNQDSTNNINGSGYECLTEPSQSFTREHGKEAFPLPYIAFILLIFTVVGVESLIELVFGEYLVGSLRNHILLDSALMIILLLPFFYYFLYRPYKKHHEYHNKAQAQIHYLSRQLINTSETERKLLSQNLHDGFGQALTAMQFRVETIKSSCLTDDANRAGCLAHSKELSQQISDLGDFVRDVSTGLHPHMLEELGLKTTLKSHLDDFEQQYTDIKVAANFSGIETRLPSEIQLVIYRICQESLNNIVKHAKANNVSLSLDREDDILDLCIKDDGKGFDLKDLQAMGAKRSGIGLLGMRERVAGLGGRLYLDSGLGKGTSIHAKIPIQLRRRKHEAYTGLDS